MKKIFLLISAILFLIPFFWFKTGLMDLGGDSSRLYFYDPIAYLQNYSFFAVSPSSIGAENIGFMTIPLVVLFSFIKMLGVSSAVLIRVFHGLSLASAFAFVYLSVKELLRVSMKNQKTHEISAIASGLLYVFSPVSIYGWDKVLITHNHVFLNPLMFYLLLRYTISDRRVYLFWALLVTFIFSANFSFVAAPVFFAFYPLTLILLLSYKNWVLEQPIRWRDLVASASAFVLLQAFHIVPQIASMMTSGSVLYSAVFTSEGKYDRGLGYFSAIAPNIKASINMLMVPQMGRTSWLLIFMIFLPFVMIFGLMRSRLEEIRFRKTLLLESMVFLVIFFFATANITDLGLSFYKKLFMLPGFSIYRNFYGQWASSFFFYYSSIFGLALAVVLSFHKKIMIAFGVFIILMVMNAWPFINGSLTNPILWQSTNSRVAMNMDPFFAQAVEYIRQLPSDGKVITLPLTDPGYQIVAGKSEGVYQGPSMISYLAGKQDFAGTAEFGRYREILLDASTNNDTTTIKRILGALNIRYIFYNSDPRVYDAFPAFPYEDARKFFPKSQKEYAQFVESLALRLVASFDNRFYIYEMPPEQVIPRVYIAKNITSISGMTEDAPVSLLSLPNDVNDVAFFEGIDAEFTNKHWYPVDAQSALLRIIKNPDPFRIMHHAFVTTPVSSIFYPLVTLKETIKLRRIATGNSVSYIDQRSFLSAKRILELERWGVKMPMLKTLHTLEDVQKNYINLGGSSEAFGFANIFGWQHQNNWEAVLTRYYRYFDESIRKIDSAKESPEWKLEQRFLLSEYLLQHRRRLTQLVRQPDLPLVYKAYLENVLDMLFGDLLFRVRVNLSDLTIPYKVQLPRDTMGLYDLYIDANTYGINDRLTVSIENASFQVPVNPKSRWTKLGTVHQREKDPFSLARLSLSEQKNLLSNSSRMMLESEYSSTDSASLTVDARYISGAKGLAWRIDDWQPQSYYLLSFAYRTSGESFIVRTLEGKISRQVQDEKVDGTDTIAEDMLKSSTWAQYQAVVRTNKYVNTGFIQISPSTDQSLPSRVELKGVSLIHIPHPLMMFTKQNEKNVESQPNLSFVQGNPTMYKIHVSGADQPYVLSLSEAFNMRWRLSLTSSSSKGVVPRMLDAIDRVVPIGRSKSIATMRHFQLNGYANAWYITPEDTNGQSEYDLELYMSMQSYFYIGAAVSMMTVIGLLIYAAH